MTSPLHCLRRGPLVSYIAKGISSFRMCAYATMGVHPPNMMQLPPLLSPPLSILPPPFFMGVPGYHSRENFGINDACR